MSRKRKKKSKALAKRYGHFGMANVNRAGGAVRQFAHDHPLVAGAAIGGAAAAIAAGAPVKTAALIGAIAGIGAQETTKR